MKTWTLELSEDELIALSRACCFFTEELTENGSITFEELQTIQLLQDIDDKFPEEEWFSAEVRNG